MTLTVSAPARGSYLVVESGGVAVRVHRDDPASIRRAARELAVDEAVVRQALADYAAAPPPVAPIPVLDVATVRVWSVEALITTYATPALLSARQRA